MEDTEVPCQEKFPLDFQTTQIKDLRIYPWLSEIKRFLVSVGFPGF